MSTISSNSSDSSFSLSEEVQQCPDDPTASSTHHNPGMGGLPTIMEEDVDETATTRHEPSMMEDEEVEADAAAAGKAAQDDPQFLLHKKVAEIASKAYNRASEKSNVLSDAKLADIALMEIEELDIGKFLGKGSFSHVHEINEITMDEGQATSGGFEGKRGFRRRVTTSEGEDPRRILANHHRHPSGECRYAIKFLKEEVRSKPQRFAVGTADLVMEGMFLASLQHPNIIKVRGLPEGGVKSLVKGNRSHGYFLILDRLFDTLSDRIYGEWQGHSVRVGKKFGLVKNKGDVKARHADLAIRLRVALDISAALNHLHSKKIIYRDLKPENLGFDVRGDIKLFDLGLVKELHPTKRDRHDNYKLSMAGTPRYMAPEVGLYRPYNLSADVYSFAMLLWEILALQKPLKDFTFQRLKDEIFMDGDRPNIRRVPKKRMRALVRRGWHQDPRERPSMEEMYEGVKLEILRIEPDFERATLRHDRRRSTFVAAHSKLSARHLMNLESTVQDDVLKPPGANANE